jgi:hypothetical protein
MINIYHSEHRSPAIGNIILFQGTLLYSSTIPQTAGGEHG